MAWFSNFLNHYLLVQYSLIGAYLSPRDKNVWLRLVDLSLEQNDIKHALDSFEKGFNTIFHKSSAIFSSNDFHYSHPFWSNSSGSEWFQQFQSILTIFGWMQSDFQSRRTFVDISIDSPVTWQCRLNWLRMSSTLLSLLLNVDFILKLN